MYTRLIVILVLLLLAFTGTMADAAEDDAAPKEEYNSKIWGSVVKDYPGRNADDSRILNVAQFQVEMGLQYYYKLHGEWPESWQKVEDSLLFQVPIRAFSGELIDPDDSSGGFIGDLYYDAYSTAQSTSGEAHLREMDFLSGPVAMVTHVKPVPTYAELFPQADAAGGITYFTEMLTDDRMMEYMALLGVIASTIRVYDYLHGHPPYSWNEFLDSGMAPIGRDSINPVTGQPFKFDGSPYDIRYDYKPESHSFFFTHLDENGRIPVYGFTY